MLKIIVTGDLCPINRISDLVEKDNYAEIYNDFGTILQDSDFNITNLECPLYNGVNTLSKSGPSLKVNDKFSKILVEGKFHLATLANNHIMDSGAEGLKSTIDALKAVKIPSVGAGLNIHDAREPHCQEINGSRIAILNFTENEFSTTKGENAGANPLNPITNYLDIKKVKEKADFVFVIAHGGHEYYELPSPRMQETYRFFIEAGADAVIGHHTHCYSGYELYNGNPIFYSLGNFIFDWPKKRNSVWNEGYAVQFNINDNKLTFDLIPYKQGGASPGIQLMKGVEKENFKEKIKSLNSKISDPIMLKSHFLKFTQHRTKDYTAMLQPYSGRISKALYYRGILPSLLSKQKKKLLLNLIRCESHRDVLIEILNEDSN